MGRRYSQKIINAKIASVPFTKTQLKEKEINEENGDLAHQESAKLKHMLLIAENENQKLKQQLASTQAGDLENISSENAKLSTLNSRYSAEIEELKLAKLELDEQTTKQKYQIENFEAENRRLKAEHKELTEERRRLVDDRAKLAEEFEQKIKVISEFEKSNETNENELEQLNSRFLELEAENSNLLEKLEEAEQVNKRLREGNLKVQDHEVGFRIGAVCVKNSRLEFPNQESCFWSHFEL